jgi:hypothetical protein
MVKPSPGGTARYLSSLASELRSQSNRVRDLIGGRHWLSDGHHKEELLRAVLRRHSPTAVEWRRGFVLCPTDADSCSTEQDILAADLTQEAPIFAQGDLIIAFPRGILAAISVKTTLTSQTLSSAVIGLNSVRNVAHAAAIDASRIWCGAYFYERSPGICVAREYEWITEAVRRSPVQPPVLNQLTSSPRGPDLIAVAEDALFRIDYGLRDGSAFRVRGFGCDGLATAMFLVNVLDHIAHLRGRPQADLTLFAEECVVTRPDPPDVDATFDP